MPSFRECNLIFISEGVTVGKLEDARVVVIVSVPVHGRLRGERRQLLFEPSRCFEGPCAHDLRSMHVWDRLHHERHALDFHGYVAHFVCRRFVSVHKLVEEWTEADGGEEVADNSGRDARVPRTWLARSRPRARSLSFSLRTPSLTLPWSPAGTLCHRSNCPQSKAVST